MSPCVLIAIEAVRPLLQRVSFLCSASQPSISRPNWLRHRSGRATGREGEGDPGTRALRVSHVIPQTGPDRPWPSGIANPTIVLLRQQSILFADRPTSSSRLGGDHDGIDDDVMQGLTHLRDAHEQKGQS